MQNMSDTSQNCFFKKNQIHEMHFYSLIEHPRSNDIFGN